MPIELDASKIYTLEIYYLVREEIKEACFHTSMTNMTSDNESQHFICKDDLLHGKLFQVSVRHSDNHVQCSRNFFYRKGYLCRHAFAALQQCSVHKIPPEFVKPRWIKTAVKIHSTLGSSEVPANTDKRDRKKLKRTLAWFEFNNCMKYADDDEDKIDTIITGLHSIGSRLQNGSDGLADEANVQRVDTFVGPIPQNEVSVQNPCVSRNKGCGGRIKSSKEISINAGKQRKCSTCGKREGHNARTCPLIEKTQ